MKIRIEEREYEGTDAEIMEQLRRELEPERIPDADSYTQYLCANFTRTTGLPCVLPETGVEERARTMLRRLAYAGALLLLDEN